MATPTANSVPTTGFFPDFGNDGALQNGVKWGGVKGTGVVLTYSIPQDYAWFEQGYSEFAEWYELNAIEIAAVRSALAVWGSVANIAFVEVADGQFQVGELRFAKSGNIDSFAHAYYPGGTPKSGDVWFKEGSWHDNPSAAIPEGSYDYLTILHEIGHALGLEHSFEGSGRNLDDRYDGYAFTIMSYSATPGGDNYASFYPTTPMYYDLVNIQGIYGRGRHNHGDTTYTFRGDQNYWETIDDSGGTDRIVHKGTDRALIDLNIGHWSDLGRTIVFNDGSTTSTVMIGPRTMIENATGGSGRDRIIGNGKANALNGGAGKDTVSGKAGADRFVFDVKPKPANLDTITDFKPGVDLVRLSAKVFDALSKGAVSPAQFDRHFDYDKDGVLSYHGNDFMRFKGVPDIGAGDLVVG
jgi:hypothetical protein